MSNKKVKLLSCYQDLQRAAVPFYLNPKGKVHLIFLKHALEILDSMADDRFQVFKNKIRNLIKRARESKNVQDVADEILTAGILLKS